MKKFEKLERLTLRDLVHSLGEGRFVIPNFQRDFEWESKHIQDLMRSIFLDYYIGNLLLWKGEPKNFDTLSCESIYGFNGKDDKKEHIVLDGQQRLTALHYAFFAPNKALPNRSKRTIFFVRVDKFMEEEHDDAFYYDSYSRRIEKILNDREKQFKEHIFPLFMIGKGWRDLYDWLRGYEEYWQRAADSDEIAENDEALQLTKTHADNAKKFNEYLSVIIQDYKVAYIELGMELDTYKVCQIFTKINSKGVRLDVFDLMNALLTPKGVQLKEMWREAKTRLEFVDEEKMNVYVLQVMSIREQAYCSPKYLYYLLPKQKKQVRASSESQREEILIQENTDFKKLWNQAVDAIESSINLLKDPREFGVISSKYLPYTSILPVFASLQTQAKTCPPKLQLGAQNKIKHWYWASVFMKRYSGSTEAISARDFMDMKKWIEDDKYKPSIVEEFKNQFHNIELRKETKGGSSSIYNGIFNLLVLQGARDWYTGKTPQLGDLDDHHIIPKSWGKNLERDAINTILNRTLLTKSTNRGVIGKQLPNQYLPELIKENGEREVLKILETHFISREALDILLQKDFTRDDFEKFITERQKTIRDVIANLTVNDLGTLDF